MGRPPAYRHGPLRPWSADVQSDQNSQQLADPYTLTHVTHGVLLFAVVGRLWRTLLTRTRVVVALGLECAWEVFENTDAVIQRYRAATVSLGYYGDSVLNSVGDILAAALGCALAAWLPVRLLVAGIVLLEAILAVWIRDNLTLNILMLLHPIEAIRRWQLGADAGVAPAGRPAGSGDGPVGRGHRPKAVRSRPSSAGDPVYLSLIAACTFFARSGGIALIPWAVLACSAPFFMTSATSCPSITALQPGIKSPQWSTFAMMNPLSRGGDGGRAAEHRPAFSQALIHHPRML
jgi:hypothetical protein